MSDPRNRENQEREAERLYAFAPNNKPIIGTADKVLATARFNYGLRDESSGEIEPMYIGSTDIHWDTQETILEHHPDPKCDGATMIVRKYVDEDGEEWLETQLSWRTLAEVQLLDNLKGISDG